MNFEFLMDSFPRSICTQTFYWFVCLIVSQKRVFSQPQLLFEFRGSVVVKESSSSLKNYRLQHSSTRMLKNPLRINSQTILKFIMCLIFDPTGQSRQDFNNTALTTKDTKGHLKYWMCQKRCSKCSMSLATTRIPQTDNVRYIRQKKSYI